jgi:hypothetical protein
MPVRTTYFLYREIRFTNWNPAAPAEVEDDTNAEDTQKRERFNKLKTH